MTCKNCDNTFEGKFCPNCGQTANIHRVTGKHFLHEMFHAFTHTDKGILLLAKELVIRPGHVAREWLDGKRKKYFNPLSFLVITTAIYATVSFQTGYFKAMTFQNSQSMGGGKAMAMKERPPEWLITLFKAMREAGQISIDNGKVLGLFLIFPLMAFFSWILFKPKKTNYAENLVLSSFLMGEMYLIMIFIFIPAYLIMGPQTAKLNNDVFHGISLLYTIIAYRQFFKNNLVVTILKSTLVMILYIVFFWLSILVYVLIKNAIIA